MLSFDQKETGKLVLIILYKNGELFTGDANIDTFSYLRTAVHVASTSIYA